MEGGGRGQDWADEGLRGEDCGVGGSCIGQDITNRGNSVSKVAKARKSLENTEVRFEWFGWNC